MLDNSQGNAFTDKPFFNSEFIRINKLKELNGQFTYKKPGEVMRNTEFNYVYRFDDLGRLVTSFETRRDDGTTDTTWNTYTYNEQHRLLEHRKGDGNGFTATMYEYDEAGRVTRESYVREYLDSLGQPQRTILNSETMKYEEYDGQLKKTVYNSFDLPYMRETTYYNELGYITSVETLYIMTSTLKTHRYEYNDKGYLSAIRTFTDQAETPGEEVAFLYDDHGNLMEKQIHRNGVYMTEIEMLYNERSMILTYVLTRDVATNFIMILGFKSPAYF
jgi:YD repeat-containing protein